MPLPLVSALLPFQTTGQVHADISPDAAYHNGAKKNVLDALNGAEKETALPFWEDYYTALIRQYKTMQTEQGRQQTAEAAKTVQAILYALRETES